MTDKRQALIRQLSVVFSSEGMTHEEALHDATTFVDEAMKLGREGKRKRVKLKCTTCKHGQAHGPGGSRRCELASYELVYGDEPPGWCPLRGVAVEETSQLAERARKVDTNAVEIGMPYQDAVGRWLVDLRGGSVLSFKDEQEARSFGGRWDAQREALQAADENTTPSRCSIVDDVLRVRDEKGSLVLVLDLREVALMQRITPCDVCVSLRNSGARLDLFLLQSGDCDRVIEHVASLRGRTP